MIEPEITSDWIDRYNENELDESEKAVFQKRMSVNPLLRSEVDIDARLNHFLQDDELIDLMTKIRSASQSSAHRSWRFDSILIAASLLCIVMMGGIFYLLVTKMVNVDLYTQRTAPPKNEYVGDPLQLNSPLQFDQNWYHDSVPFMISDHHGMLAQNFEPLAEFELLIGSATRSNQFKLISPGMNISVSAGSEVKFAWQNSGSNRQVEVVIMNNHAIPVSGIILKHGNTYTLKTDGLSEGLYYWKVMMDDELVLMGKITIH